MRKTEENLSGLSVAELNKKAKTAKLATGLLAGMLIIQLAVGIFLTAKKGFNVFIVMPLAFLPILIINFTNIKKINDEIARRNS